MTMMMVMMMVIMIMMVIMMMMVMDRKHLRPHVYTPYTGLKTQICLLPYCRGRRGNI